MKPPPPAKNRDLHGNVPDDSPAALVLIDMISDFEFEDGDRLFTHAMPAARRLAALTRRAKAAGVPVIYANDTRILDRLADSDLRFRVEGIDQTRLMMGLQKIANRITVGLLLASLIIGAAMLMQVETGLAILFFVLAACGAVTLILTVFFEDE